MEKIFWQVGHANWWVGLSVRVSFGAHGLRLSCTVLASGLFRYLPCIEVDNLVKKFRTVIVCYIGSTWINLVHNTWGILERCFYVFSRSGSFFFFLISSHLLELQSNWVKLSRFPNSTSFYNTWNKCNYSSIVLPSVHQNFFEESLHGLPKSKGQGFNRELSHTNDWVTFQDITFFLSLSFGYYFYQIKVWISQVSGVHILISQCDFGFLSEASTSNDFPIFR